MSVDPVGRSSATDDASGRPGGAIEAAVRVCRAVEVPDEGCLAVLAGRVLLARIDGTLVAYRNQCLHKATPLDGGLVRDGVVTCPLHFWRYDLRNGANLAGGGSLDPVEAWIEDDAVLVVPPPPAPTSLRQLLRDHARHGTRSDEKET